MPAKTVTPSRIAEEIRRILQRDGSVEHAKGVQWFFKEEIKSHGWRAADLRWLARGYTRTLHKEYGLDFVVRVADQLFRGRALEEKVVAVLLLEKQTSSFGDDHFALFESWLDRISSWADHDALVHYLIAPMMITKPGRTKNVFKWAKSQDRWHRRAACVALIQGTRQKQFFRDITRLSGLLLQDEDDMVQKGLGWLLRETAKADRKRAVPYLLTIRSRASRLVPRHCPRTIEKPYFQTGYNDLSMNLSAIQSALRERDIDAWFFYDHHHRDPIAYRVLGLPEHLMATRRWFYVIPVNGEPRKLVHKIESYHLDSLPGEKGTYAAWPELFEGLKQLLGPYKNIAMQYSPNNGVFTISLVDGGTLELIRSLGKNVVSSGDLVALFEATWTEEQIKTHFAARDSLDAITAAAFQEIGRRVRNGGTNEFEIQQWLMEAFARENIVTSDPPVVAVNANSANPHYGPDSSHSERIREGDFVLLDIWGKKNVPNSVYYDITWTGFVGKTPLDHMREVFNVVRAGRDSGIKFVQDSIAAGNQIAGWQVDDPVRQSITKAGYGNYFVHRSGHSIATEVHGNGPNMDNLEVHDERRILPNSCFSIEPGVYLKDFGVRSEVNMLVRSNRAEVTGRIQTEIVII